MGQSCSTTSVRSAQKTTCDVFQLPGGFAHRANTTSSKEERLRHALLSPTSRSDVAAAPVFLQEDKISLISDAAITSLITSNVPGASKMMDRCGQYPVCHYICLSYRHGIPAQASAPALQRYTKLALRYILQRVSEEVEHKPQGAKILSALAEAYQGCQQIQARTIDNLFGALTGRDQGLRGQLFELVDFIKQQTLDEVTLKLHPNCLSPSADMGQQMLHIQSSYVTACGEEFGLRGVETSKVDRMKPRLCQKQVTRFMEEYVRAFPVQDVVQAFVRDVNQVAGGASDSVIGVDTLFAWCNEARDDFGFDAQKILFQDEQVELYATCGGPPPRGSAADGLRAPWLHYEVAHDMLLLCFADRDASETSGDSTWSGSSSEKGF